MQTKFKQKISKQKYWNRFKYQSTQNLLQTVEYAKSTSAIAFRTQKLGNQLQDHHNQTLIRQYIAKTRSLFGCLQYNKSLLLGPNSWSECTFALNQLIPTQENQTKIPVPDPFSFSCQGSAEQEKIRNRCRKRRNNWAEVEAKSWILLTYSLWSLSTSLYSWSTNRNLKILY